MDQLCPDKQWFELLNGRRIDCNNNGILDSCELDDNDCNTNGIPDDCEEDCDRDGIIDDCELDTDQDGIPDDCDADDDGDGIEDACDAFPLGPIPLNSTRWDVAEGGNGRWYSIVEHSANHFA